MRPNNWTISTGSPDLLGLRLVEGGANIAVFSQNASRIELCLFDKEDRETRLTLPGRTNDIHHGFVPRLAAGQRYGLRAHGANQPDNGHRFDPSKLLVDPYALALDRDFSHHPSLFGPGDSAAHVPKAIALAPHMAKPKRPSIPFSESIIYEAHVKGLTKCHPKVPLEQRGTFAALVQLPVIAHLKNIGVTAIEVMPVASWIDERHLVPLGLTNYWGYNSIAFMAPDRRLAPGGWSEIRKTVDTLHDNGLELIVDVVFNHSGEGDQNGPTVSLRGLDNARYYRLRPEDKSRYVDDTGCGNMLACDDPMVVRLMIDSLRAWAEFGGVDGFRFDLATTLGRRASGFDVEAPFFMALKADPVLKDLKLIMEAWDIGPGGYQVGRLPMPFADWNDAYRDDVRRFWRGDGRVGALATRLAGSPDLMGERGEPARGVNFVTAHDGFTLADLVSYERKHNHANGENNRDGRDDNASWNNGIEGQTDDPAIQGRRARDQINLLATLMFSMGTPMLSMGAEHGKSQNGNNNAYCQDNALSWLDWAAPDDTLTSRLASIAALRAAYPLLRSNRFLTGKGDVAWLHPAGRAMEPADWDNGHSLLMHLSDPDAKLAPIIIAMHRGDWPEPVLLPDTRAGHRWRRLFSSDGKSDEVQDGFLPPRSVSLYVEASKAGKTGRSDRI